MISGLNGTCSVGMISGVKLTKTHMQKAINDVHSCDYLLNVIPMKTMSCYTVTNYCRNNT